MMAEYCRRRRAGIEIQTGAIRQTAQAIIVRLKAMDAKLDRFLALGRPKA
jgi:hypothetical protein